LNDDGDDFVDFDGGQSIHGACSGAPGGCPAGVSDPDGDGIADPDPQCVDRPWRKTEKRKTGCGLGGEILPLVLVLRALRRRRPRAPIP
jgi:hypothetical protein